MTFRPNGIILCFEQRLPEFKFLHSHLKCILKKKKITNQNSWIYLFYKLAMLVVELMKFVAFDWLVFLYCQTE